MRYDRETGKLYRANGKEVIGNDHRGYRRAYVFGKLHLLHRVIWYMEHGRWPVDQIDHINGNRADNRIENLREVDNLTNAQNQARYKNNTTGVVGVAPHKRGGFTANIEVNGVRIYLGYWKTIKQAAAVRAAAQTLAGYHQNHGRD